RPAATSGAASDVVALEAGTSEAGTSEAGTSEAAEVAGTPGEADDPSEVSRQAAGTWVAKATRNSATIPRIHGTPSRCAGMAHLLAPRGPVTTQSYGIQGGT